MSKHISISRFVQADPSEGCDWAVFVDLSARPVRAQAAPISQVPHDATIVKGYRRATANVAMRVAAKLNASKRAQ